MKKPKKDPDSNSQTDQVITDQTELDRLCKGFVDWAYYHKAMANTD